MTFGLNNLEQFDKRDFINLSVCANATCMVLCIFSVVSLRSMVDISLELRYITRSQFLGSFEYNMYDFMVVTMSMSFVRYVNVLMVE